MTSEALWLTLAFIIVAVAFYKLGNWYIGLEMEDHIASATKLAGEVQRLENEIARLKKGAPYSMIDEDDVANAEAAKKMEEDCPHCSPHLHKPLT